MVLVVLPCILEGKLTNGDSEADHAARQEDVRRSGGNLDPRTRTLTLQRIVTKVSFTMKVLLHFQQRRTTER